MEELDYDDTGVVVRDDPVEPGMFAAYDRQGNHMQYRYYDGHYYSRDLPQDVAEHLKKMADFECRDSDVFIASYPKSGLHWMSNVVSMLVKNNLEYIGTPRFMDFEDISQYSEFKSPRVFGSHMWYDRLPRQVKAGKGKIINISRNPKDVATSFNLFFSSMKWSPYTGDMAGYFRFFLRDKHHICDSWYDSVKSWEEVRQQNHSNVLMLQYEDVKRNFYANIVKLSTFLELDHKEEFLRQVEDKCTFSSMKDKALLPNERWKDIAKGGVLPIYRKGSIGEWKNHMTVAQSEEFDAAYAKKMSGVKINFIYE